jgi:hypothetical protein
MLPVLLAALTLLPFIVTSLATPEQAFSTTPGDSNEAVGSLQFSLAAAGLEQPQTLSRILRDMGLSSVQDVWLLNLPEQLELVESLREEGVNLGSRSRLRRLSEDSKDVADLLDAESSCRRARGKYDGGTVSATEMFKTGPRLRLKAYGERDSKGPRYGVQTQGSDLSNQGTIPSAQRRQLQSGGGGFSIEVAAITFTGLIGIVGYAMQAQSAQKASQSQASLGREAAEREKAEAKAGKQLERVQLQMSEWVRPFMGNSCYVWHGWIAICQECKLLGYLRMYSIECAPQPATPYSDLVDNINPDTLAAFGRAPYAQLPPEDLALLAADQALRSRYCELVVKVLLPPLQRLGLLIVTKMLLNESLAPARLDALLPGIGRTWASLVGTLSLLFWQLGVYVGQFESLVGRWEEERFDLLQPDTPGVHVILTFLSTEQSKDVAAKEMQLVGVSSGSRAVAGGLKFMQGGAVPVGDAKEAET